MGKVWEKGGDQTYVTPKFLQKQDCKLLIDIKCLKFPCREIFLSLFKLKVCGNYWI